MKKVRKSNRFFRRFIITYALAFLVFIIFGIAVYKTGMGEMRRYLTDVETARFEEQVERFLFQIDLIESIPVIINAQESTYDLARLDQKAFNSNIDLIQEYTDYLRTLDVLDVYTSSIAVYFHIPEIYVGDITTARTNLVYEDLLQINDWPFEKWRRALEDPGFDGEYLDVQLPDVKAARNRHLIYMKQLPIDRIRPVKSVTVMTSISVDEVFSSFTASSSSTAGFLTISYDDEKLLIDRPETISPRFDDDYAEAMARFQWDDQFETIEHRVDGRDYLLLKADLDDSDWSIVSGIPLSIVIQKMKYVPLLFSIMAAVALLVFIALAVTFAQNNSRLLERVMDILNNKLDERPILKVSGFDSLYTMARKVVQDKQILDQELAMRNIWLQGSTTERLMRGIHESEETIDEMLSSVGLKLWGDQYFVAVLRVTGTIETADVARELAIHPKIIQRSLIEQNKVSVLIHELKVDTVGFIFGCPSTQWEETRGEVEEAFSFLKIFTRESDDFRYFVGVGSPKTSLMDIHQSCKEALTVVDYSTENKGFSFACYDEIVSDEIYTAFPVELEAKLSRIINTYSEIEAERVFMSIFPDSFLRSKWSVAYREQFKSFVMGIVIKLFSMENVASYDSSVITIGTFRELQEQEDLDVFRDRIFSIVKDLIRYKHSIRDLKDEQQIKKIVEMIDEHYTEPDFTVSSISDAMHITPGYLSSLFKKNEGESISARIESIRLEQAVKLLGLQKLNIQEVQYAVGYRNANTFYKAFRRKFGRSPKDYRSEVFDT